MKSYIFPLSILFIFCINCIEISDIILILNKKLRRNIDIYENLKSEMISILNKLRLYSKFLVNNEYIITKRKDQNNLLLIRFFNEKNNQIIWNVLKKIDIDIFDKEEIFEIMNKIGELNKKIYLIENEKYVAIKELQHLKKQLIKYNSPLKILKNKSRKLFHSHTKFRIEKSNKSEINAVLINDLNNFHLIYPMIIKRFLI